MLWVVARWWCIPMWMLWYSGCLLSGFFLAQVKRVSPKYGVGSYTPKFNLMGGIHLAAVPHFIIHFSSRSAEFSSAETVLRLQWSNQLNFFTQTHLLSMQIRFVVDCTSKLPAAIYINLHHAKWNQTVNKPSIVYIYNNHVNVNCRPVDIASVHIWEKEYFKQELFQLNTMV